METLFPKILEWSISLGIAITIMAYFIRRDERKDRERIEERQRREERVEAERLRHENEKREMQKEFIEIIKTSNEVHIKTTLAINDLIERIDRLAQNQK